MGYVFTSNHKEVHEKDSSCCLDSASSASVLTSDVQVVSGASSKDGRAQHKDEHARTSAEERHHVGRASLLMKKATSESQTREKKI